MNYKVHSNLSLIIFHIHDKAFEDENTPKLDAYFLNYATIYYQLNNAAFTKYAIINT